MLATSSLLARTRRRAFGNTIARRIRTTSPIAWICPATKGGPGTLPWWKCLWPASSERVTIVRGVQCNATLLDLTQLLAAVELQLRQKPHLAASVAAAHRERVAFEL